MKYIKIDGNVAPKKRSIDVQTFNMSPNIAIMLATTRVGGVGLNLT